MKKSPQKPSTTRKLTLACRDNLEIAEWARTCGREVSTAEISDRRDLAQARRARARNRSLYNALKHSQLGPTFAENKTTPQHLT